VNKPKLLLADEPTSNLDDIRCVQVLDLLLAQAQSLLVFLRGVKGARFEEGLAAAPLAAAAVRRAGGHAKEWSTLFHSIGNILYNSGHYTEALVYFREAGHHAVRAFGADSVQVARNLFLIANVFDDIGRDEEAAGYARHAYATAEAALGPNAPEVIDIVNMLGGQAQRRGDFDEARGWFERACEHDPDNAVARRRLSRLAELSAPARPTAPVAAAAVVLIEGILVLALPAVCALLDLRVFVAAPEPLRRQRRLERDCREREVSRGACEGADTALLHGYVLQRREPASTTDRERGAHTAPPGSVAYFSTRLLWEHTCIGNEEARCR